MYLPHLLRALTCFAAIVLGACASQPIDQVDMMPAPDVYADGLLNPLPEQNPLDEIPYKGILYATDREPAGPGDKEKHYLNDRGQVLRLGVASVELGDGGIQWGKAREISMLTNRTEKYPVKVAGIEEWGMLENTVPYWLDLDIATEGNPPPGATVKFTQAIDAQLARSAKKHVYIYVHGYNVVYENPILIASELWHFLGYNGAFIAYAWPSTPSRFAYIKDSDTSAGYSRNLRLLVETIAKETEVEQIHILGYSNGTRLVMRAMEQLALIHQDKSPQQIQKELKIGDVILVGSDLDRGVFGSYVADGLLNISQRLTIYLSDYDKALGVSQFLTRRQRLGQMWGGNGGEMTPAGSKALSQLQDQLSFINVSPAEGAGTGNGHGYFRSSPWASSDVLMTLFYGLKPDQRGLVKQDDLPVYTFPPDYIARLWSSLEAVDPIFAQSYREFKEAQAEQSD
jgi:esterase/lipase superfamily enzyme